MISIFLSSTFQDMQHERDLIHKYVYPVVKKEALQYGEILTIIDLRWGIDTSDLSSDYAMEKVLNVCRNKIQAASPFFITMLGKRYGSKISNVRGVPAGMPVSVTEYEINQCITGNSDNAWFFIKKDIIPDEYEQEQKTLIQKIMSDYPQQIVYYQLQDKDTSDTSVTKDEEIFIAEFINKIRNYIAYQAAKKNNGNICNQYMMDVAKHIYGREKYRSALHDRLSLPGKQKILLWGPVGIGKRSILYKSLEKSDWNAVILSSRLYRMFSSVDAMLVEISAQIDKLSENVRPHSAGKSEDIRSSEKTKEREIFSNDILFEMLSDRIRKYQLKNKVPLVIVIEDIDLIVSTDQIAGLLSIVDTLDLPVKWCLTGTSKEIVLESMSPETWMVQRIPFLSDEEKAAVTKGIYDSYDKEVPPLPMSVLNNKRYGAYPEYIYLLASLMNNFDSRDLTALNTAVSENMEPGDTIAKNMEIMFKQLPDNIEDLYYRLLSMLTKQIPEQIADAVLDWLVFCSDGLREEDLHILIEQSALRNYHYSEIEFYLSFMHLQQILTLLPNQIWKLRYPVMRNLSRDQKSKMAAAYISYLESLPQTDPLRRRDLLLVYLREGSIEEFYKELSSLNTEDAVEMDQVYREIVRIWISYLCENIPSQPDRIHLNAAANLVYSFVESNDSPEQYLLINHYAELLIQNTKTGKDYETDIAIYNLGKICELMSYNNQDVSSQTKWRLLTDQIIRTISSSEDYFSSNDMVNQFLELSDGLKSKLDCYSDLAEARSILDRNLPVALCRYVIKIGEDKLKAAESLCDKFGLLFLMSDTNMIYLLLCELKGDCCRIENDYVNAIREYEHGLQYSICEKSITGMANSSALYSKLGLCYKKSGMLENALNAYQIASQKIKRVLLEDNTITHRIDSALITCHMADVYSLKGEYKRALDTILEVESVFKQAFENQHTVQSLSDYATFCYKVLEIEETGRVDSHRGIQYGKQAAYLFIQLKQVTGNQEYIANANMCLDMIQKLQRAGD